MRYVRTAMRTIMVAIALMFGLSPPVEAQDNTNFIDVTMQPEHIDPGRDLPTMAITFDVIEQVGVVMQVALPATVLALESHTRGCADMLNFRRWSLRERETNQRTLLHLTL